MIPFRTTWTEFQGDSANSGYAALHTGPASDHKWTAPAPSPGGGSPIVDPLDGSIYVADGVGQLWKYRDNGVVLWTRSGGTSYQWGSTPAIDRQGRIYTLFSNLMESVLVCFNRDGDELWRSVPGGHSTADFRILLFGSPKVWNLSNGGALIFLTLGYLDFVENLQKTLLFVFNQQGLAVGAVWFASSLVFVATGGGGFALAKPHALPHTHAHLLDGGSDSDQMVSNGGSSLATLPNQHLWEPTCAVIDGDYPDYPNVIATDGIHTVAAFRWVAGEGGLFPLWKRFPSRDGFPRLTPPAVLPNGLLALGCSDGYLKLLDPASGDILTPWPDVGAWMQGTPASFLRQIYVTTRNGHVAMIDSNGLLIKKVSVTGQIASSALVTASHVYVSTATRFYTFDLDLNRLSDWQFDAAGISSPAVGPDGTIYLIADDELHAFAPPRT